MLLTEDQEELFLWICESGSRPVVLSKTHDGDSLIGENASRAVNETDLRELAAQSLIRSAGENRYELTNSGRGFDAQLTSPAPPEVDPPGYI
jgi:hypothetical protein